MRFSRRAQRARRGRWCELALGNAGSIAPAHEPAACARGSGTRDVFKGLGEKTPRKL